MRRIRRLASLLALSACTFGPAVRSPGYGTPGRLREGQLEVGGGVAVPGGAGGPGAGGPYLAYAVRDWANVEVGADFLYRTWALGYLGGRFTYAPKRDRKFHGALDGELGVGVGAGGSLWCPGDPGRADCDGRRWYDRFAVGAYTGGGAGYHLSFFSVFARGRVQTTVADGLPPTTYGVVQGGIQFRIARHVDLHGSGGIFGTSMTAPKILLQPYWDVGLSVRFDVRSKRRPSARAEHRLSL